MSSDETNDAPDEAQNAKDSADPSQDEEHVSSELNRASPSQSEPPAVARNPPKQKEPAPPKREKTPTWKRALAVLVGLLAVLAAILVVRASGTGPEPERHPPLADLDVDLDRVTATLSEYIQVDTSTPPGILASPPSPHLALLIERYVEPLGLEHQVLAGRSLLIRWRADDGEDGPLLLLSHSDVVPVAEDERSDWAHPPFSGDVAGGFVWGRGAIDNKASTVCQLEAIAAMQSAGLAPKRDVFLLVVPDEEIGGERGAGMVVDRYEDLLEDPRVVLDEGGIVLPDIVPGLLLAGVAVAEKHFVTIELTVEGPAGHSSMPREDHAPRVLAIAVGKLAAWEQPPRPHPDVQEPFFDAIADEMPFGKRIVLRNRWLFGGMIQRELESNPATSAGIRDTHAITMLRGGVKDNVVPARVSATVNMRLLPGSELDTVLARVAATIGDPRVQIEVVTDWQDTPVAPTDGELWDGLTSAIVTALPDATVAPVLTPGTVDARYFAQRGIPSYRFVPFTLDADERSRVHGVNERISIDNLEQAVRVYAHIMRYW